MSLAASGSAIRHAPCMALPAAAIYAALTILVRADLSGWAQTGIPPAVYLSAPMPGDERRYDMTAAPGIPAWSKTSSLNVQRQAMIRMAAGQLVELAVMLRNGLLTRKPGASLRPQVKVASTLATLARDLREAEAPGSQPKPVARKPFRSLDLSNPGQLQSFRLGIFTDTERLVAMAEDLETQARTRQAAYTLSVGVFARSLEVEQLAHSLKDRIKKAPVE